MYVLLGLHGFISEELSFHISYHIHLYERVILVFCTHSSVKTEFEGSNRNVTTILLLVSSCV
jgi:hypothetical protein